MHPSRGSHSPSRSAAGTSGGVPYFNSTSTWATSAALAANALVVGGGAGVAPSTVTTGTGVVTALGVNVGSAGAFVTFNGAGGTPSSIVLTNATGTAASLTAGNATLAAGLSATLAVTSGGTGRATSTTAYGLLAAGTTATGAHQTLAAGATTEILVGGGASALPVWTTATGTGAPVRADSPTITTIATIPSIKGSTSSGGTLTLSSTSNATKGKILFGTSAYDEVNNRLGIGDASPALPFVLTSNNNTAGLFRGMNTAAGGYCGFELYGDGGTQLAGFGCGNSAASFFPSEMYLGTNTAKAVNIYTNSATNVRMYISATGGVSIGNTTDAGAGNLSVTGRITANSLPVIINLSATTGIDAKTTGTTSLYTVPAGKTLIVTGATVRCTAASAITIGPTLGIGVAAGEDDIFASTTLTTLTTTAKVFGFTATGMSVKVDAGGIVKLGLDTAATGTSQTLAIDLIGYLY